MATLWDVAEYLAERALESSDEDSDVFAKSAFNRYYYDIFYSVKGVLITFDEKWKTVHHADVGSTVAGKLVQKIGKLANDGRKTGTITEEDAKDIRRKAEAAAKKIKALIEQARNVRTAADYSNEVTITYVGATFSLEGCSNLKARGWRSDIHELTSILIQVKKDLTGA